MADQILNSRSPFTALPATEIWGQRDGQTIFVCPGTQALFFDRGTLERTDYQDYYPYLKEFDDARFAWELAIRRRNYVRQLALMHSLAPGTVLADIGAGPGYLCRIAEEEGWTAYGVELSDQAVYYGMEKYGVKYRGLDDLESRSLDSITCHHVFEHVFEPMKFLDTLYDKLKQNGLLVWHVPHQQPLTFKARGAVQKIVGKGE